MKTGNNQKTIYYRYRISYTLLGCELKMKNLLSEDCRLFSFKQWDLTILHS
jgi:hypothetical protein